MDILKKILRESLACKAERIFLECNQPVTLWTAAQGNSGNTGEIGLVRDSNSGVSKAGRRQLTGLPTVTRELMDKLIKLLVPSAVDSGDVGPGSSINDSGTQFEEALKIGALEVAGLGLIQIILRREPYRLELYIPPAGDQLYIQALKQKDSSKGAGNLTALPKSVEAPSQRSPVANDQTDNDQADSDPAGNDLGGFIPNLSNPPDVVVAKTAPKTTQDVPDVAFKNTPFGDQQSAKHRPAPQIPEAQDLAQVIDFGPAQGTELPERCGTNSIDRLLEDMVEKKASDLHLTCGEPPALRLDGLIVRLSSPSVTSAALQDLLLPIIPSRNRQEFVASNDTDFAYEIDQVGRFRVNIFRDRAGVSAVLRHIPATVLSADQLGLPNAIRSFCTLSKGLVLVTGPTGSGKSTTLAAMIDLINETRSEHILTIEDPIEFVHQQKRCLIRQREIFKHTTSFSRALKAALREDPDIVLIGEMRDLETIAVAVETAETGHLVFGTLHTTTAVSTIDRIIDQFPSDQQQQIRMMLAASLKGVVAQTLIPKIGGGRVAAHEILVTNDAVGAMIREGKNHMIPNHIQSQKASGNILLSENIGRLVKEGLITPEDAMAKSVDKVGLLNALRRFGVRHNLEEDKKPA